MKRSTATSATDPWPIYNCHIHTFTKEHAPRYFLKWVLSDGDLGRIHWARIPIYLLIFIVYLLLVNLLLRLTISFSQRSDWLFLLGDSIAQFLQTLLAIPIIGLLVILVVLTLVLLESLIDLLKRITFRSKSVETYMQLRDLTNQVAQRRKHVISSRMVVDLLERLKRINPGLNDVFERTLCFLRIADQLSQEAAFWQVQRQYPKNTTVFIVLPMDMTFMNLGKLKTPVEDQHEELLSLARNYEGQIVPFYAADPRHADIVERVWHNLAPDKFRGINLYPNLGYKPDDPRLMEVYKLCIKGDFPVLTHCSPGGLWRYGLTKKERRANSSPLNYKNILDTKGYQNLRLCLAHFGGAEEWVKDLKGGAREDGENSWVRTIYDMIASGKYPNLYTDISYTVFIPKMEGLLIELVDYLKVLLIHPLVRQRVLFGNYDYMVEQPRIPEREASLLLRSRLGEDLYKQIAYTNAKEFLGIGMTAPPAPPSRRRQVNSRLKGRSGGGR